MHCAKLLLAMFVQDQAKGEVSRSTAHRSAVEFRSKDSGAVYLICTARRTNTIERNEARL